MRRIQFDLQQVAWVTSLVAIALAFFRLGGRDDATLPDALFFIMIIILFPVWGLTKKQDSGTRFILVGSVMLSIVMNGIILTVSESRHGDFASFAWIMRVAVVGIATTLWLCFTLTRD